MNDTNEKKFLSANIEKYGEFRVTPELLELTFPEPHPILNVALARAGNRATLSMKEQMELFCLQNNYRFVRSNDGVGFVFYKPTNSS